MTLTVLLPDYPGAAELVSAIDGVRVVSYDPQDQLSMPAEAVEAEVFVPPFLASRKLVPLAKTFPKLKLVQLLSAGAEAWIGALPEHVRLSNCRGAHGGSTAEWVVGALLSIYRDFREFDAAQRAGEWTYHPTDTLQDKRILVVGAGDLGYQLERRLTPFDTEVTLVGRTARAGVRGEDELPDLLGNYDVVIVVVPMTEDTRHLVDAKFLACMADGAIFVNAARGPVVDTDALLAELTSGRLRAALDVTDPEPLPAGHPLWTAPNLLLTPHVAGSVAGQHQRAFTIVARQIAQFAAGQDPDNLIRGSY
ncbi:MULTISPECIES: 2-hydroxyacid dehydrogenase [unclassified Crossiella]|uniref:2-hydroxyacid dehydrogenase n=1 Tax=unclassified Crossiella TaxID=2620835 RepID=UPI001FFE6010|nr:MULTISPECIES: 2-hydroxyacid dehydrogenase [unclassified Crossiella]MCK2242280.1 2-hydroxyacid dehydrogenase [Crossiella sp. S99.2]MCK2254689.1 2-hydroxyacid dehydrogenase [Crossiella sp. S99.1]